MQSKFFKPRSKFPPLPSIQVCYLHSTINIHLRTLLKGGYHIFFKRIFIQCYFEFQQQLLRNLVSRVKPCKRRPPSLEFPILVIVIIIIIVVVVIIIIIVIVIIIIVIIIIIAIVIVKPFLRSLLPPFTLIRILIPASGFHHNQMKIIMEMLMRMTMIYLRS